MAISRRDFCGFAVLGVVGSAGCATVPRRTGTLDAGVISVPRNTVLEPTIVTARGFGERIVVLPSAEGVYRAFSARCSHLGCDVSVRKDLLACPCHGSVFDFAGKVVRGPAQRPLREYPVEAIGDSLTIRVS